MSDQSSSKPRKPWWFKLLIALALLIAGLIITACVMDIIGRKQLNRAIAEARAMGQPVSFEEILAERKVWPSDQDAGRYFMTIKSHLAEVSKREELKRLPLVGEADFPPMGQLWSSESDQAISAQLDLLSE